MRSNVTWPGLLCGAILMGGHGLCSAVAAGAPGAAPAPAGDEDNSYYAVIVERNVFALNPPPPPPAPPQPPPPKLPLVKFSGTRTEGTERWAMFAVTIEKSGKETQDTTSYMSLKEGDSSGPVQLLKIGPGGEEVTILNTGNRVVLNMRDNGFGSTKTAAPGAPVPAGLLRQPPVSGIPASPTIPTAMMPGQLVTPGVNTGINLGAPGASSSSRTDISVAGRGTAPGTINYPGVQQTVASTVAPAISLGANNGGNATMVSGAFNPAPPSASATLNATPAAVPGAMPPNSTPPNTIPVRNGITPPFPGR